MFDTKEKKERALGTKLFLKAERCSSAKCATIRRPHRPGIHGKSRRRGPTEVGRQLQEKQKIRFSYGVKESYLRRIFARAIASPEITGKVVISLLERRLDNVVYRLGLALSRAVGRQLVGHGHITVNGRKVIVPSFEVKKGDVIGIRSQSQNHPLFHDLEMTLKKQEPPQWLELDKDKKRGKVITLPQEGGAAFNVDSVVDYYIKRM